MEIQLAIGREVPYSFRRLGQHRGIRVDGASDDAVENGETISVKVFQTGVHTPSTIVLKSDNQN